MYTDRTDYAGGQDELANITLQYDTSWQQDVDALETRVKGYKAEKDATEEAARERDAGKLLKIHFARRTGQKAEL